MTRTQASCGDRTLAAPAQSQANFGVFGALAVQQKIAGFLADIACNGHTVVSGFAASIAQSALAKGVVTCGLPSH